MYIQKIKITNFKSIYEPFELDFTDITGLWKISGSVGAGKTTIGEAIIYGLFGTVGGKNNGDLISWGQKHGLVEIWCQSKKKDIYIKRELNAYGQSPIYVEVDGEELVFTNKRNAQTQLEEEYYDTSKVTLELLCIISFNNFKSLATLNAADTKKFLDQVLGFHALTEYSDACKELRSLNSQLIVTTENEIRNLDSQINKLIEISNIDKIEGDIEEVKKEYKELEVQHQALQKESREKLKEIENKKKEYESQLTTIITLGKHKAKEIKFIEQGTCPTCGAKIDQSQLEIKRQEKDLLMKQYNQVNDLVQEQSEQYTNIYNKYSTQTRQLDSQLADLKELGYKLKEQNNRIQINVHEIENLQTEKESKNQELAGYQAEDAEWESLYNILSTTVRSYILQSFIPVLNKNILKYTQRLHLPYLVEFDSNFKCSIQLCGLNNSISISSLSTGQLKTVDMVIILGVLGTVMGSNNLNIMFLDELFSNLDANLRNEMCTVLKESLEPNSTMFIISHTELEDAFFDGTIHMKLELQKQFEKHSIATISKK